jgi:hypothetical protein
LTFRKGDDGKRERERREEKRKHEKRSGSLGRFFFFLSGRLEKQGEREAETKRAVD